MKHRTSYWMITFLSTHAGRYSHGNVHFTTTNQKTWICQVYSFMISNPPLCASTSPKTCGELCGRLQTNKQIKQLSILRYLSHICGSQTAGNALTTHSHKGDELDSQNNRAGRLTRLTVFSAFFWWLCFLCKPRIQPRCRFGVVTGNKER